MSAFCARHPHTAPLRSLDTSGAEIKTEPRWCPACWVDANEGPVSDSDDDSDDDSTDTRSDATGRL